MGGLVAPSALIIDPTGSHQHSAWISWKKTLEFYFVAANINETKRKKAVLLYCGGEDLRKIHETLNDSGETYKATCDLLSQYFEQQINVTFERHLFRNIIQNSDENSKTILNNPPVSAISIIIPRNKRLSTSLSKKRHQIDYVGNCWWKKTCQ